MPNPKYYQITLPSGSTQIWDESKVNRNQQWLKDKGATTEEVNQFEVTLPSGSSQTWDAEKYGRNIDWLNEHKAQVRGSLMQDQTATARQEAPVEAETPEVKPVADTVNVQQPVVEQPDTTQVQKDSVKQPIVPPVQPVQQAPVESQDTTDREAALAEVQARMEREAQEQQALQQANREQVAALNGTIEDQLNQAMQESSNLYDEGMKKKGFFARGLEMMARDPLEGFSSTTSNDRFTGAGNPELTNRIQSLQAAQKGMKDAQKVIDEANHAIENGQYEGWLEKFAGGARRGFGDKFADLSTWDMGMSDARDAQAILSALQTYESGKPLTDAQQTLLDAKAIEMATQAYFGSYLGRGYKAGAVTAESLPFMLEMMINPASSIGEAATNRMARYAIKRFGKEAAKSSTHKILRGAGRAAADLVGAGVMTATTGAAGVAANTMERMAGDIDFATNAEGESIFAGVTPGSQEDFGTAFAKAFADRTIENYSEMVGEYFAPLLGAAGKGVGRGMDNLGLGKVKNFISAASKSDLVKIYNDFAKQTKWNGTLAEYAEEVVGNAMNALTVGDMTMDAAEGTGVFNLDQNIDTFLGVALLGGALSTIKTSLYRTPKYQARQHVNDAARKMDRAFDGAPNWEHLAYPADVNAAIREVLTGDYTPEQRQAYLQYTKAMQEYEGTLEAESKRRTEPETPEDILQNDLETSYDNGYTLATDEEMNDAKNNLELQRQKIQELLGVADIDETQILNEEDLPLEQDQRQAALDYLNAKATYDGLIHRIQDDINERIAAANAEVDINVNPSDGQIHPAEMLDGRHVYITGGNVTVAEDGTIDKPNSTRDIIIRDPETGKKEFSSLDFLKSADPTINPQEEKEAAAQSIREQMARNYADRIDGRLQFNLNDVYQLTPPEGEPFTVQVVANEEGLTDNGDGTVNVLVGNDPRPQLMQKDVVQQLADATRLMRLGLHEQQKIEQRAAEEEAARPAYAINDELTLDVEGAPIRGSITDISQDGIEVYTELPVNGRKVNLYSPEQLDAMVREHNGQAVEAPVAPVQEEIAQEQAQIEQNPAEIAQQEQEIEQPEGPAIDRIPKDEKTGEPIFEQGQVADTYQALLDMNDGDEAETVDTANQMVSNVQKELEKAEKAKAKGTTPMEIQRSKAANRENVKALQKKLDYWQKVAGYPEAMRKSAEEEQRRQRRARLAEARKIQERNGRFAKEDAQLGEPLSFRDFIMRNIANGFTKFKWSDDPNSSTKGLGSHLGFAGKPQEAIRRGWLLNNETGLQPEAAAEELLNSYAASMGLDEVPGMTTMDALNEVLDVLNSYDSSRSMFDAAKMAHEQAAGITEHIPAVEDVEEETEIQEPAQQAAEEAPVQQQESEQPQGTPMSEEQRTAVVEMLEAGDGDLRLADIMSAEDADAMQQAYDAYMEVQRVNEDIIRSSREEIASTTNKARRKIAQSEIDKAQKAIADALTPLMNVYESITKKYGLEQEANPELNDTQAAIQQAREEVNPEPTEAQKEAGNYRKGHVTVDGYDISIENAKGSTRSGVDAQGNPWETVMNNDYGYIRRTEGVDGDHIDVFLSDNPEEGNVFVVDQVDPDTGAFDEHKVMYGFPDADAAREAYLANYSEGWQGLGNITEVTKDEFKKWIESSHRKTKPFAEYKSVKPIQQDTTVNEVNVEGLMGAVSDMYAGKRSSVKLSEFAQPIHGEENSFDRTVPETPEQAKTVIASIVEFAGKVKDKVKRAVIGGITERQKKDFAEQGIDISDDFVHSIENSAIIHNQNEHGNEKKEAKQGQIAIVDSDYQMIPEILADYDSVEKSDRKNSQGHDVIIYKKTLPDGTVYYLEEVRENRKSLSFQTMYKKSGTGNSDGLMQDASPSTPVAPSDNSVSVSESKDTDNSGESNTSAEISITPAQYTTKKGRTIDMFLVQPGRELTHDEYKAVSQFLKENRGWKDRENGGFMVRSEEQANTLAGLINNPEAVADAQPVSLAELREVGATTIDTSDVQAPAEDAKEPVWKYELHSNPDTGYSRLERSQVLSDGREIWDGNWEVKADSPTELKAILENNNMYDLLPDADKAALDRRIDVYEFRKSARENGVNGYHLGDKVLYKGREATIHEFEDYSDHRPVLDSGLAPVIYEIANWEDISKIEASAKDFADEHIIVTGIPETKKTEERPVNPSGNKLVTDERYEELRRKMLAKLTGQMNMGIDPEILAIGTEMAVYHIEKGARKFVDYAKVMIKDLGDVIRPYLKAFYNAVRDLPEAEQFAEEMTPYDEVQATDVASLGKEGVGPATIAETIVKEREVEKQAEEAENKLKKVRNSTRKSVTSHQKEEASMGDLFAGIEETEPVKEEENGLQGNDAERSEGSNDSVQPGSRAQETAEGPGETAGQESGRPDSGRTGEGQPAQRNSRHRYDDSVKRNTNNNRISKGEVVYPKTEAARFKANIEAIRLLKQLQDSGKKATKEQMAVLRQFTGWGGLGGYFNRDWSSEYKELQSLLTDEEMRAAAMSINTAYYTPVEVIDTMWDIAKRLGFEGGSVLEGSAGIGNILASMPKGMSERSEITAVELDNITGGILELLYPDATVQIRGFEEADVPNGSVDLAITNVPFGDNIQVYDAKEKDLTRKFGGKIHDFCIAKNIRKLAEGGIGIFITTRGTMDSGSKALRQWITDEGGADVIGAFRLNNETFEGTGATSDILVVRKRVSGKPSPNAIDITGTQITRREKYSVYDKKTYSSKDGEAVMEYNTYFVEHPENMGGEMGFGFEHNDTFRPGSAALYPTEKIDQSKRLARWSKSFSSMQEEAAAPRSETASVAEAAGETKEGQLIVNSKGEICMSRGGKAVPIDVNSNKVKGRTKKQVLEDYDALKSAINEVLDYQTKHESDEGLKPLLAKLNKAYDDFVKRYGNLHKNTSISFLRNDVDFASVAAVEDYKETKDIDGNVKVKVKKTGIFGGRVIGAKRVPTPANVRDGIIVSINQYGRIDIPFIAQALGRSEESVRAEALSSGLGFENPETGAVEVDYEYLSGNVRDKLRYAQEHNEGGKYDANIKALEKVIPPDIPAHLIEFSLGSDWLPTSLYTEYAMDRFGLNDKFVPKSFGGQWAIKDFVNINADNEKNRAAGVSSTKWNEVHYGHELMLAAMNKSGIQFSRVIKHEDGTTETEYDREAMQAASTKIDEMRDDFKEWCREKINGDEALKESITKTYNDTFNAIVPKEISETFLPEHFEGQVLQMGGQPFNLYPHQAKAVIKATTGPLMMAHEVGTGKTFTLITTAMEMRRLGTAKKPMIVVQNSTLGQFVSSAKALYPNAKVLSISEKDHTAAGRSAFYAKIKYNDWDIIIVPQSVFERIPDNEERKRDFIQEKIDEKMFVIQQAKDAGNNAAQRQLERELLDLMYERDHDGEQRPKKNSKTDAKRQAAAESNAAARAKKQLDRSTDEVADFDDMGIDALLIDEAHNYKHLGFSTRMSGRGSKVKGIDPNGAKRSAGLYLKSRAVFDKVGWKNVVFATGTPISNTAAEIWTFMKYLMPADTMRALHIYYFDDFVSNFGNIARSLEFKTNGQFSEVTRFSGYSNLPELVRIWSTVADTVLTKEAVAAKSKDGEEAETLSDKVPVMEDWTDDKGEVHKNQARDIYLPQSQSLIGIMNAVRAELDRFEKMSGKEKREHSSIPLVMFGIAKKAAIDPRLVDKNAPDEPLSKTNRVVEETLKALRDSDHYHGTAAIFCDNYQRWDTDSEGRYVGFNLFEEIKRKLVEAGVPENQIAIMSSRMSTAAKEKLFAAVNNGDVRVIMGSTDLLGVGVNIQERLFFEAHLDAPNRPMDYTQRMGRIIRQGNLHKEWGVPVRVVRFGVEDSLDVTAYQRLSTKSKFINSVMDGKPLLANGMENRVLEDEEEGEFDNPVAVLSGSQYALLKSQAERELRKLRNKKEQHRQDQIYIEYKLRYNEQRQQRYESQIKEAKKDLSKIEEAFPEGKVTEITIEGKKSVGEEQVKANLKKLIGDKVRATIDALRKEAEYSGGDWQEDTTQHYELSFNGLKVRLKVDISGKKRFDLSTRKTATEISTLLTYTIDGIEGTRVVSGGINGLNGIVNDISDNVATGKFLRDYIGRLEADIEHMKSDNELMLQRRGKPFQDEEKLAKQEEVVADYTKMMREELAAKEAKYAEMAKAADMTFSVSQATESAEAEEEAEGSGEEQEDTRRYRDSETIFISNALNAVEGIQMGKATPQQWLRMIESRGGLKAGEDKWIGLSDWLNNSDQKTITKQEVLDYIAENAIQIEEQDYSENIDMEAETQRDIQDRIGRGKSLEELQAEADELKESPQRYDAIGDDDSQLDEYLMNAMKEEYGDDFEMGYYFMDGELQYNIDPYSIDEADFNQYTSGTRKIDSLRISYTTPKLEDKREIALIVPSISSWGADDRTHFGDAGDGRAVAWIRFGETEGYEGVDPERAAQYTKNLRHIIQARKEAYDALGRGVTGKAKEEAEQKLINAEQRLEKIAEDFPEIASATPKRILVIDEIQSKRHQEGRERGYQIPEEEASKEWLDALHRYEDISREVNQKDTVTEEDSARIREARKTMDEARDAYNNNANAIPDAPFEKNWHELAMKRMIRYAAENGYDAIAWTTGDQQAARYSIGGSLDAIQRREHDNIDEKQFVLSFKNGKSQYITTDDEGNVTVSMSADFKGRNLSEIVGKEMAERMLALKENELMEGDGLNIGGNGMRYFYDEMLPRFMNKYGKRWDVSVHDVVLPHLRPEDAIMHSVNITPEMAEAAMNGQLMFRIREEEPPKKTGIGYKVFVLKNGRLYPPMVANPGGVATPVGVWLDADAAPVVGTSKTGRKKVKAGGPGTQGGSGTLSYRPGWHLGTIPYAIQFNRLDENGQKALFPKNFVWAEVEYADDVDYQDEAMSYGKTANGGFNNALAGLPKVPVDGSYTYRTNPDPKTDPWIITGAMKVNRLLTPSEVDAMVRDAGREPQKRQAGAVTDAQIDHLNAIISDEADNDPAAISQAAKELGDTLGVKVRTVQDVNELTDKNPSAQKRMRRSKGWYDTANGEIVVVVPNAESVADAKATVFHEIVGHKGLREIIGEDKFNRFIDRVYYNGSEQVRDAIGALARQTGWDWREATEEYIAQMAEEGFDTRENRSFWEKVRDLFDDMIHAAKIRLGFRINDNDLRYALWRTYQMRKRKGAEAVAEDIMMQRKMQVGQYAERRFRDPDEVLHDRVSARRQYEKSLQRGLYQFREAVQDSMLGLRELMQAIVGKNTNIEDVDAFENAYLAENAMSSMNKAEQEAYYKLVMSPLLQAIAKLKVPEQEVKTYMMAKHGLERNIVMAERYGREAFDADTTNTKTLSEHIADARKRDYAGLMGLTGTDNVSDAEAEATKIVSDFESAHDVTELWEKTNAATKASLQKLYESGLLTKEGLDAISGMYENYVPLRGFDATTSDEVYGYLTDRKGLLQSPLKKAEGRSSQADDPIAYIASMADTAIMQGNRNRMKQRFLNFVLNHPSDLVSVSDIWLSYDDTTDEWKPVFANLLPTDTPEEVEQKVRDFNEKMKGLAETDPDHYKSGKDTVKIPYKIVGDNLREHQVLVKRNGRTYVLTINGNPRAAQALNGLTNPDTDISGFIGSLIKGGQWVNRNLSSVYTTRNVEFVASNFLRDMFYSNLMTWVKESPRYALAFHRNFAKYNPGKMMALFNKWEKGSLDEINPTEKLFQQYMLNGGETGYTTVKDLEKRKKELSKQIERYGKSMPVKNAMDFLGESFDILNRGVENCARFAAFVTSREMGRSIQRSVYDAKEVSVNFNKKGAGDRFVNAAGQTTLGKIGGYTGAAGRLLYVFWNAGVQGLTNFGRAAKRHPGKAIAEMSSLFILGMAVAALAGAGGGDDDDMNAYYNLPEYVRRSNICFRVGKNWVTLPLPIEFRGLYGLGELAMGVLTGKEHYSDSELAYQIGSQVSQVLPLDMLEGGGGISPFIPSAAKPVVEAYIRNKSWTGMPIYKDTYFNKNMPEWTKAYKSANKQLVELAEAANRMTGGDEYTKGAVDLNPARIEYLLSGYFGGYETLVNKLVKMAETAVGAREFEWRNMLVASRVIKSGDERTAHRKLTNEYYSIKEEAEKTQQRMRGYENRADDGDERFEQKLEELENSPEYMRYEIYEEYGPDIDAIRRDIKEETDPEVVKELEAEMYDLMRQMVNAVHEAKNK